MFAMCCVRIMSVHVAEFEFLCCLILVNITLTLQLLSVLHVLFFTGLLIVSTIYSESYCYVIFVL